MHLENDLYACEVEDNNYLTAKEPEQRVAHIPPIVAPGPVDQI